VVEQNPFFFKLCGPPGIPPPVMKKKALLLSSFRVPLLPQVLSGKVIHRLIIKSTQPWVDPYACLS